MRKPGEAVRGGVGGEIVGTAVKRVAAQEGSTRLYSHGTGGLVPD